MGVDLASFALTMLSRINHTGVLRGVWPLVAHHIRPAAAHNILSASPTTQGLSGLLDAPRHADRRKDMVLLVADGIDCRIHTYNRHTRWSCVL